MKQITQITQDALQEKTIILEDGTKMKIQIYFMAQQLGWFINFITYENIIIRGIRICNSGNILRQFKNIIPFGLSCVSFSRRDPSFIQDFDKEFSKLYVLNSAEVQAFEDVLSAEI